MIMSQPKSHVLVIEDQDDIQTFIHCALRKTGCLVSFASNGEEALKFLSANNPPDIIILDLTMPVMDGFQFRQKQLSDDSFKNIPVLLYSSHDNLETIANDLECDRFLKKDATINQLTDGVLKMLSARHSSISI